MKPLRTMVKTGPNRAAIALLVALCLTGVASSQGANQASDTATAVFGSNEWLVVSFTTPGGPFELLPGDLAFFKLRPDGALAGTAGCNQMSSFVTFGEAGSVSFGPVIATRMACAEPQMAQEFAIVDALEQFTHYTIDGPNLELSGGGYVMVLAPRSPGGSAPGVAHSMGGQMADALDHGKAVARYAAAFNDAVAAAASAGAEWPSDPIRVALAFLELKGAPNTMITRADFGQENATRTRVSVIEDGFLDDSVAGLEQHVTLDLVDGVWVVGSYEGAWLCRRPPGTRMALPGVCQ
ncbi:MAG TPA: META domain-containing protein [Trueperaceae bacterium]|nr:META domain-containing protein [Trueperaceae bacterium]